MILATGAGSILEDPNFHKKEYLGKLLWPKKKKTLVILSQKLLHRLSIC